MGQKVNPISLRLEKTNRHFDSCWYDDYNYTDLLLQDYKIKTYFKTVLKQINYPEGRVLVEKSGKKTSINLFYYNPTNSRRKKDFKFRLQSYKETRYKDNTKGFGRKKEKLFFSFSKQGIQGIQPSFNKQHPTDKTGCRILPLVDQLSFPLFPPLVSLPIGYKERSFSLEEWKNSYKKKGYEEMVKQTRDKKNCDQVIVSPSYPFSTLFLNVDGGHNDKTKETDVTLLNEKKKGYPSQLKKPLHSLSDLFLSFQQDRPQSVKTLDQHFKQICLLTKTKEYLCFPSRIQQTENIKLFRPRIPSIPFLNEKHTLPIPITPSIIPSLSPFLNPIKEIIDKKEQEDCYQTKSLSLSFPDFFHPFLNSLCYKEGPENVYKVEYNINVKLLQFIYTNKENGYKNENQNHYNVRDTYDKLRKDKEWVRERFLVRYLLAQFYCKFLQNKLYNTLSNQELYKLYMFFQKRDYKKADLDQKRNKRKGTHTIPSFLQKTYHSQNPLPSFPSFPPLAPSKTTKNHKHFENVIHSSKSVYKSHLEFFLSKQYNTLFNVKFFRSYTEKQGAFFLVQEIIYYLERKIPFRRIKTQVLKEIPRYKRIKGIRISCSGRVGGRSKKAQRSKTQSVKIGQTSLGVFSCKIDFACKSALTRFGLIGVKVWICYQ